MTRPPNRRSFFQMSGAAAAGHPHSLIDAAESAG